MAWVTEKLRKYLLTCFANCYKFHPDKINRKTTLAARSTMEQATPAYQNFLGTDEHAVKTKIWIATATSPSPKTSAFSLQPSCGSTNPDLKLPAPSTEESNIDSVHSLMTSVGPVLVAFKVLIVSETSALQ